MRLTAPPLTLAMLLLTALLGPGPAAGQPAGTGARPGAEAVLYFRHADTDHSQNDTRSRGFDDCANQRLLTDRGRDHARALGEAIRALGLPIGAVLASPVCRTVETATLAFGSAERAGTVREAGPSPPGTPERFRALRGLLSTVPAPGTNTVIVGHAYPFFSLVGGQYLDEGEAAVVRPLGAGFEVRARVGLKEWRALAAPAP